MLKRSAPASAAPAQKPSEVLDLSGMACDACAAGAALLVALGPRKLAFCGHHYRAHEHTLATSGWRVVSDQRDRLLIR